MCYLKEVCKGVHERSGGRGYVIGKLLQHFGREPQQPLRLGRHISEPNKRRLRYRGHKTAQAEHRECQVAECGVVQRAQRNHQLRGRGLESLSNQSHCHVQQLDQHHFVRQWQLLLMLGVRPAQHLIDGGYQRAHKPALELCD